MAKHILIEVTDGAEERPEFFNELSEIPGVVGIRQVKREFGRSYRGMGSDVLPTGTVRPERGKDQYERWVSTWTPIDAKTWADLGAQRG